MINSISSNTFIQKSLENREVNTSNFKTTQSFIKPEVNKEKKPLSDKQKAIISLSTAAALVILGIAFSKGGLLKKITNKNPKINLPENPIPEPRIPVIPTQNLPSEKTEDELIKELESKPLKIPGYRNEGDSRFLFDKITPEEKNFLSNFLSKK